MKLLKFTKEQKTGLFALLTLAALYITVNYLKGKDLFSSRNTYYAIFEDVQGLTPTGPVYIKGLKIGTIETINYNEAGENFCVELKISSDYTFPKKSTAESFSSDIMGTRALRIINSGQNSSMQNRDTFLTSSAQGLPEMLASEFTDLKKELSSLIISTDTLINNINHTLSPSLQKELSLSVTHLRKTLAHAQQLTASLEKSAPAVERTIHNIDTLTSRLGTSASHLDNTLQNTTEITAQLKEADLAATITSLRDLLEKMKDPQSTTGKLLTTDSLHNSTDRLIKDLDTLIKNITENPRRYIKISVF
jgi:phospholipid/cholesterol/gamma-HCH transport system substrate-binding protein